MNTSVLVLAIIISILLFKKKLGKKKNPTPKQNKKT